MNTRLLFRDRGFDFKAKPPWHAEELAADLDLETLFAAMSRGDEQIHAVVRQVILAGVAADRETVLYRQKILEDCLRQPGLVRELFDLATEGMGQAKKRYRRYLSSSTRFTLWSAIEELSEFLALLKKLRQFTEMHAKRFSSEGWLTFFRSVKDELNDVFFAAARDHLGQLKFPNGVLLSARLGMGSKGYDYILHKAPPRNRLLWIHRLLTWFVSRFKELPPPPCSFTIHPRDEAGHTALDELESRAIRHAAKALARTRDNVCNFYAALHDELAFFIGCLNLHERLTAVNCPWCFGVPLAAGGRKLSFEGLYDLSLALRLGRPIVGNDVNAEGKTLVVVTGANQGGKSTFLRSVGQAQLLLQCGMPVPAGSFSSSLHDGIYTHFRREEDATLTSGKLDEEFLRMSRIIDHISRNPLILFNESFAATNEREGAEIGSQIISALVDCGARVVCVTHMYELARWFHDRHADQFLFLRAERKEDGARTFRLIEGGPLRTSYGEDLYRSVFGAQEREQSESTPARPEITASRA